MARQRSSILKAPWSKVGVCSEGEGWFLIEDANKPKKVVGKIKGKENAQVVIMLPDLLRCAENALRELQDLHPMSTHASALQACILKCRGH